MIVNSVAASGIAVAVQASAHAAVRAMMAHFLPPTATRADDREDSE